MQGLRGQRRVRADVEAVEDGQNSADVWGRRVSLRGSPTDKWAYVDVPNQESISRKRISAFPALLGILYSNAWKVSLFWDW